MAQSSTLRSRIIGVLISLGLLLALLPAAVFVTILLFPLWSVIEDTFGIESVGHSGPADWCYIFIFAVLVLTVIPGVWRLRRRHRQGLLMAKSR